MKKVWHSSFFLLRTEPWSLAQEKEVRPTKPALMPSLPPLPPRTSAIPPHSGACVRLAAKCAHRSHFGSRYTKGRCTCAGLIVDFPKRHRPCSTVQNISYAVLSFSEDRTPMVAAVIGERWIIPDSRVAQPAMYFEAGSHIKKAACKGPTV